MSKNRMEPKPLKPEEIRDFFDALAEEWDERCYHDPRKLRLIVDLCLLPEGAKILDIGCATGAMTESLLAANPAQVVGLDLSPKMIEQAKAKFSDPRTEFLVADLFEYEETDFDLAMLYSVYPHFMDKAALAQKVADCLKPGGRFMVAHSESRHAINLRHSGGKVEDVSESLRAAEIEVKNWQGLFEIDTLIDHGEFYVVSGTKRA